MWISGVQSLRWPWQCGRTRWKVTCNHRFAIPIENWYYTGNKLPRKIYTEILVSNNESWIKILHQKLKANAAAVKSTLGCGSHGLLNLTILSDTYQTVTGYTFVAPANPGGLPIIAPAETQAQSAKQRVNIKKVLKFGRNFMQQIWLSKTNYLQNSMKYI